MLPSVFSELFTRTSSAQASATSAAAPLDPAVLGESLYDFQNGAWPTRTEETERDLPLVKCMCLFWCAQE